MNILIKTLILTTAVFLLGVVLGQWIGQEKIDSLEETTNQLQKSLLEAELQLLLMDALDSNVTCSFLIGTASDIADETDNLAREVERSETAQSMNKDAFMELKSTYTITLIKDWLTLEKIKKNCNGQYSTLLYFYSNENCDYCQNQGIILSHLKRSLNGQLMVFAIDTDLDISIVNALIETYQIDSYPAIVLNNKKIGGYVDLTSLTNELCNENNELKIC